MGKKKNNNGRKFFACEVKGKKIKFPKKLRNKITSYRRIGYGPTERDVLIGEIVNGKYLVFPLDKEMDLDNSELYIIERTPGSIEEEETESTTDVVANNSKDEVPAEKIATVSETLYKSLGLRKVSSIPNDGLFKYDNLIWIKKCTEQRTFIGTLDGSLTFARYIRKKLNCSNPYNKMYHLVVEQVSAITPEEEKED